MPEKKKKERKKEKDQKSSVNFCWWNVVTPMHDEKNWDLSRRVQVYFCLCIWADCYPFSGIQEHVCAPPDDCLYSGGYWSVAEGVRKKVKLAPEIWAFFCAGVSCPSSAFYRKRISDTFIIQLKVPPLQTFIRIRPDDTCDECRGSLSFLLKNPPI